MGQTEGALPLAATCPVSYHCIAPSGEVSRPCHSCPRAQEVRTTAHNGQVEITRVSRARARARSGESGQPWGSWRRIPGHDRDRETASDARRASGGGCSDRDRSRARSPLEAAHGEQRMEIKRTTPIWLGRGSSDKASESGAGAAEIIQEYAWRIVSIDKLPHWRLSPREFGIGLPGLPRR